MPIDPSIPLQYRPAQVDSPLESVGRLMSLQQMMQQGKITAARMQQIELENRERQRDLQDDQTWRQSYIETLGDYAKTRELAIKRGASPKSIQLFDQKEMDRRKELSKLDDDKFNLLQKHMNVLASAAEQINAAPEEQRAARYQQMLPTLKAIKPDLPDQFDYNWFGGARAMALDLKGTLDAEEKRREEERKKAEFAHNQKMWPSQEGEAAAKAEVATRQNAASILTAAAKQGRGAYMRAKYNLKDDALAAMFPDAPAEGYDPEKFSLEVAQRGMTAEQQATDARQREQMNKKIPGRDVPLPPAVEEQRTRISSHSGGVALPPAPAFGTSGERNEDYLKQLDQATANQVKAIVEGRYPVPTGAALRSPQIMRLLEAASVYEPGFDLTQWKVRMDTRTDFAKGKAAINIRSLNTLVDHAGKLMDATEHLGNTGVRGWNWVGNTIKTHTTGNPALVKWGISAQAVISEAVSLFKGTGATNEEIAALRQHFNPNGTMEEQKAGVREIIGLAFGRLGALEDQYRNAFKKPRDFRFLSDRAAKILRDKVGIDPNELERSGGAQPADSQPQSGAAAANEDLSKLSTEELLRRVGNGPK